ncbi:MAG: phosphoglucomutase/phosphomannomutase family protein [Candidatus Poribacteria bacterium]
MATIKFGTSGWRAIVAEDFTFRNVELVIHAISQVIHEDVGSGSAVAIGYDGRFLSSRFAQTVALTFASEGIRALLPERATPTPVVAYAIQSRGLAGGVVLTASHNPPEYNGIKFSPANAAPAPLELTERIEAVAAELMNSAPQEAEFAAARAAQDALVAEQVAAGLIERYTPYAEYRDRLFSIVDVDTLRSVGLKVVADVFYGAGRGYLPELLTEVGCSVETVHDEDNPLFGGTRPDPVEANVGALVRRVGATGSALGLAVDGDADRFGIVDADGTYIHANHVLALVSDYLISSRGWTGEIVRSVPTSHLLDAVAEHHGASILETPTGFKYIGERFLAAPSEFILGGEESNGMTVRGHIPEKDGILACLLVAEMVAVRGATLSELLEDLFARVGRREVDRLDLELSDDRKQALLARFDEDPPTEFAGRRVERIVTLDGHKLVLEGGGFIALRASGTEPLVRCYLDATDAASMAELQEAARKLIAS